MPKKMETFYKKFEDRFRGSRQLILERLKVYFPLIEPLKTLYPESGAIDLGCGRGEWLELLKVNGFQGHGIDTNAGMLENSRERELSVVQGDALEYLKSLPDNSISIVSGFHIAEHLPFAILQEIVKESLRVLKPAGILILETPNPENLEVASNSFYLDPTHVRPLPPLLLSFLPEHYGFARVAIFRLNEPVANEHEISLLNVFNGASPDYSVVAQKKAKPPLLKLFDSEFNKKHGISSDELKAQYKQANQDKLKLEERRSEQLSELGRLHSKREQQYTEQLQEAQQELRRFEQDREKREQLLSEKTNQARQELASVLRNLAQREQEFSEQLLAIQQQAGNGRVELEIKHSEHVRALDREYAEREKQYSQQLQEARQEARQFEQDREKREQLLSEKTNQVHQELASLLRTLAQREQEFSQQQVTFEQQAIQERVELEKKIRELIHQLRYESREREQALTQQLQITQAELRNIEQERIKREQLHADKLIRAGAERATILHDFAQREQEFSVQLAAIQQQAEHTRIKLEDKHAEQERLLRLEYTEREKMFSLQLQVAQHELRTSAFHATQHEKALNQEIINHQSHIQALHEEKHLSAQRHHYELEAQKIETVRLMHIATVAEGKIKAQVQSEGQNSLLFQQTLSDLHQTMRRVSLARRVMTPLVKLISLLVVNIQTTKTNKGQAVVTLDTLLTFHDRQLVQQAYLAILGRPADAGGLEYYSELLRAGISKTRVLAQLRLSGEGKTYAANIPGLDPAIQVYQWSRIPLLGKLIQLVCIDDNNAIERALRAIENKWYRLSESRQADQNRIEAALNDLQLLRPQEAVITPQVETVTEHSEVTIDPLALPPEPEVPNNLPQRAGVIYLQLRKSISTATRNLALAKANLDARDQMQTEPLVGQLSPPARDIYIRLKEAAFIHARRSA
jgi:SAM-dependent methyltransferase